MSVGKGSARRLVISVSLIAFVVAGIVAPQWAFAATYTVSRDHDADWHFERVIDPDEPGCSSNDAATGSHRFEAGPVGVPSDPEDPSTGAPPREAGSLELMQGINGNSLVMMRNTRYAGIKLSQIEHLEYYTYTDFVTPNQQNLLEPPAIWIRLYIDKNTTDAVPFDDALTFEPTYQDDENGGGQPEVELDRWQRWLARDNDASVPNGNWWLRSAGRNTLLTLSQWIGTSGVGDATIVNPGGRGGVALGTGCGGTRWANFSGNTDAFTIDVAGEPITTYDMEPADPSEPTELDCEVESERVRSGTPRSISCRALISQTETPVSDVHIDVEAIGVNDPARTSNPSGDTPTSPDYGCITTSSGSCTIHIPAQDVGGAGRTEYVAWIDVDEKDETVEADRNEDVAEGGSGAGGRPEPDDTDVVEKIWMATRLDCEPESAAPSLGSTHTIVCTAAGAAGTPAQAGQPIDVEASGVNDPEATPGNSNNTPDFSCTTNDQGSCTITHAATSTRPNTTTGTTTYRGWIDFDGSNVVPEADGTEGVDATKTPGARAEVDDTDVVEARWGGPGGSTPGPCPTGSQSMSPTPTPTGSTASPSPTASPCVTPTPSSTTTTSTTPTPTPTESSPSPSPSDTGPDEEPLTSGPCAGYFPDSRQPNPEGDGEIVVGTSRDDQINGSSGHDVICGLGGDDTIRGLPGNDRIYGQGGSDTLRGGSGSDALGGGGGTDTLYGAVGGDLLVGGAGIDVLRGGRGNDRLLGGRATDLLDGGAGQDKCRRYPGNDRRRRCE